MAEIVKITRDQPFVLYVPLVILNADGTKEEVDASALTNISVTYNRACEAPQSIQPTAYRHFLMLRFEAGLHVAEYALFITANLSSGRQFSLRFKRAFAIVDWDYQSNWRDFLIGNHIELNDQPFIAGYAVSDPELEALKAQLRLEIAAAEQAKEDWEQKAAALDGVAQETTAEAAKEAAQSAATAAGQAKDAATQAATNASGAKTAAEQAAKDAAAAKQAAQAITGYALQTTLTDVQTLIGYTIQEIEGV